MKKIKRVFSIRNKLIFSYTSIFILILSLIIQIYFRNIRQDLKKDSIQYMSLYIRQLNENLNNYINEFERLTAATLADQELHKILLKDFSRLSVEQQQEYSDYIQNFLLNLYTLQPDISNVTLISGQGKLFTEGILRFSFQDIQIEEMKWFEETYRLSGKVNIFFNAQTIKSENTKLQKTKNVSIARQIKTLKGNNQLGVIRIDVPLKKIEKIIQSVGEFYNIKLMVLDQNNQVVYDPYEMNGKKNEQTKNMMKSEEKNEYIIDGVKYFVFSDRSQYTGWNIVGFISEDVLLSNTKNAQKLSNILLIIGIGCICALSVLISSAITKPIFELQKSMKKVEKGDFDVSTEVISNDEIGYLGRRFNNMVKRIKELIQKENELNIRKSDAELKALMAEINPHFLYNTLESIRVKAIAINADEIAHMLESLSKFFRMNIMHGDGLVNIQEEVEHLETYLYIQNIRYGNRFKYVIDIDDDFYNNAIPKLTLQPIVENAVIHGFTRKKGECLLLIRGFKQDENIIIQISDNGEGIKKSRLEKINESLRKSVVKRKNHLGLQNVNERIRLEFGEKYGIRIESVESKWTKIIISLPTQEVQKGENYV